MRLAACCAAVLVLGASLVATQPASAQTPEELREQRRLEQLAEREAKRLEADKLYDELGQAYMDNKWEQVQELYKQVRPRQGLLSREQQANLRHISSEASRFPPKWWAGTRKQDNNSFKAEIWGRSFFANYVPSRELGVQFVDPVYDWNRKTGEYEIVKLNIMVTWKPLMVDSPDPAKGRLSLEHGYTLGDIAEVIIWHELGHNYITEQVPVQTNIELYNKHGNLYSALHEFYADMTALAHASPKARLVMLQFRLDELDYYTQDESHCRAGHGIGSLVIADMLQNPDKWPSVHFPPKVPEKQTELNTIIYIYENISTGWTVDEDIRLQSLVQDYIKKEGETTFKRKGEVQLPNGLKFKLMIGEDREHQQKRDTWVYDKLNKLIADGRADKLADVGGTYEPPNRDHKRRDDFSFHRHFDDDGKADPDEKIDPNAPKRIEVPWEH